MREFADLKGCSAPTVMRACRSGELFRGPDGIDETLPQNANWIYVKKAPSKQKTPRKQKDLKPSKRKRLVIVQDVSVGPAPDPDADAEIPSPEVLISESVTKAHGDTLERIGYECAPYIAACISVDPKAPEKVRDDWYARARFSEGFLRRNKLYLDDIDFSAEVLKAGMTGALETILSNGDHIELAKTVMDKRGNPRLVMSTAGAYAIELSKQRLKALEIMRKGSTAQSVEALPPAAPGDGGTEIKPVATDAELDALLVAMAPPPEVAQPDA